MQVPTVVIVGRPNVGKSTLFNRITGTRRSIVGNEPGITRDRIVGEATHRGRPFEVIDTGGIIPQDEDYIPSQILKQARVALAEASHVIFLVDGRAEITGVDRDLAQILRKTGKPVTLAVNKVDGEKNQALVHEFHSLGIDDVAPVSAEHGTGIGDLLDRITKTFPEAEVAAEAAPEVRKINVAIIGRPNAGKSTLLNSLIGSERSIVSPIAGTTRDAVDEMISRGGVEYTFVDTAGIRRKSKTKEMAEKLSVVMAKRHIRLADVVLVLVDATEGVVGVDSNIAGLAHEGGRGIVICVNKWDLIDEGKKRQFEEELRYQMRFLDYAPVMFLSAKDGTGVKDLYKKIREVYDAATKRVTTGELNRFLEALEFEERKIFYMTQASVRPPTFVVFCDKSVPLHFSHERFLINRLRDRFGFKGTPIELKIRVKEKRGASRR